MLVDLDGLKAGTLLLYLGQSALHAVEALLVLGQVVKQGLVGSARRLRHSFDQPPNLGPDADRLLREPLRLARERFFLGRYLRQSLLEGLAADLGVSADNTDLFHDELLDPGRRHRLRWAGFPPALVGFVADIVAVKAPTLPGPAVDHRGIACGASEKAVQECTMPVPVGGSPAAPVLPHQILDLLEEGLGHDPLVLALEDLASQLGLAD